MSKRIDVYPLPSIARDLPVGGVSVAIDVLRATTTITTALANGAESVRPYETVKETFAAKRAILEMKPELEGKILLGGERGGLPINDFDLGNSPSLYSRDAVEGKSVLFTTTNGTKAILQCRGVVLLASFLNLTAVVDRIRRENRDLVSIVCAGTDGEYTEEDMLLAGAIVEKIAQLEQVELNVQAEFVRYFWRENSGETLLKRLEQSRGGLNLKRIKLTKDIADAAKIDSLDVVAEFRVGVIKLDSAFENSKRSNLE